MPEMEPAPLRERHCLLVDQGSSRIKWITAIWSQMSGHWDLDVTSFGEGGIEQLESALDSGELLPPGEVLLTSVASAGEREDVEDVLAMGTAAEVTRMISGRETLGIRNGYRKPEALGADRWMAVLAAAHHHGLPAVVMDLGTATTLDAVDHRRRHHGGLILPGPASMRRALESGTALESATEDGQRRPGTRSGQAQRETQRAIAGGIVTAQCGALAQFLRWFKKRLGNGSAGELKVVVTGGAAGAILGRSDYQLIHDPLLVFRGMLLSRYGPGETEIGHQDVQFREEQ